MMVWQRQAQLNSWMDGRMDSWWCSTLFTFLFVLFCSVCTSLLPSIIYSEVEKRRSTPPPPKKKVVQKQNAVKKVQYSKTAFHLNDVKFTLFLFAMSLADTLKIRAAFCVALMANLWWALAATTLGNRDSLWKCQHAPYTHISLNVHREMPRQDPRCALCVRVCLRIPCLFNHVPNPCGV